MTTEITRHDDGGGLYPGLDMPQLFRLCTQIASSGLTAAKSEAQALVIVLAGREYGLSPMASLMNGHLIKGRFSMSADMMAALARSRGATIELIETTAERATYRFGGAGRTEPIDFTFDLDDAKRGGMVHKGLKDGDNWLAHPKAMLRARCISQGIRAAYPGLMAGAYLADELQGEPEVVYAETPAQADQPTARQLLLNGNRDERPVETVPAVEAEPEKSAAEPVVEAEESEWEGMP